jgi:hypothetical protein
VPPTENENYNKVVKDSILARAEAQLDEEKDDVKHMNQMVIYSKCVTIWDKQLEEQKRLEEEYWSENKWLDIMMEIERLKSLKY